MLGNITGWHALILLAVIILLFGATRLPALARSVGQSARIFRSEVKPADAVGGAPSAEAPGAAPTVAPAAMTAAPASPVLVAAAPTSAGDVPRGER